VLWQFVEARCGGLLGCAGVLTSLLASPLGADSPSVYEPAPPTDAAPERLDPESPARETPASEPPANRPMPGEAAAGISAASPPATTIEERLDVAELPLVRLWYAEARPPTLDRWISYPPLLLDGGLIELSGARTLLWNDELQQPRRLDAERVIALEFGWQTPAAEQAHRRFLVGDWPAVISQHPAAIRSGVILWQQRLLLAELVAALAAQQQWGLSGRLFEQLVERDPPPLLLAYGPYAWDGALGGAADQMQEPARKWLVASQPALQLLGASWLLGGPQRGEAVAVLERLRQDPSSAIAALASAQLWRIVPPAQYSERAVGWLNHRERMLLPLQIGPSWVLADKAMQQGQIDQAVGHWLRIATLHGERYDAAVRAIALAEEALRAAGRSEEAQRLERLLQRSDAAEPH